MEPHATSGTEACGMEQQPSRDLKVWLDVLSTVSGALSNVLGNRFDAFRNKMSILQGLDVIVSNDNHHYLFPTTASSYDSGLNQYEAPPTPPQCGRGGPRSVGINPQ